MGESRYVRKVEGNISLLKAIIKRRDAEAELY
jgi:hypothetical protein